MTSVARRSKLSSAVTLSADHPTRDSERLAAVTLSAEHPYVEKGRFRKEPAFLVSHSVQGSRRAWQVCRMTAAARSAGNR